VRRAGINKLERKAAVGKGRLCGKRVLLAKPLTFMNVSGESVGALVRFYKARLGHAARCRCRRRRASPEPHADERALTRTPLRRPLPAGAACHGRALAATADDPHRPAPEAEQGPAGAAGAGRGGV